MENDIPQAGNAFYTVPEMGSWQGESGELVFTSRPCLRGLEPFKSRQMSNAWLIIYHMMYLPILFFVLSFISTPLRSPSGRWKIIHRSLIDDLTHSLKLHEADKIGFSILVHLEILERCPDTIGVCVGFVSALVSPEPLLTMWFDVLTLKMNNPWCVSLCFCWLPVNYSLTVGMKAKDASTLIVIPSQEGTFEPICPLSILIAIRQKSSSLRSVPTCFASNRLRFLISTGPMIEHIKTSGEETLRITEITFIVVLCLRQMRSSMSPGTFNQPLWTYSETQRHRYLFGVSACMDVDVRPSESGTWSGSVL